MPLIICSVGGVTSPTINEQMSPLAYGGGGSGFTRANYRGGGGGGRTAIYVSSTAKDLVTAGVSLFAMFLKARRPDIVVILCVYPMVGCVCVCRYCRAAEALLTEPLGQLEGKSASYPFLPSYPRNRHSNAMQRYTRICIHAY